MPKFTEPKQNKKVKMKRQGVSAEKKSKTKSTCCLSEVKTSKELNF